VKAPRSSEKAYKPRDGLYAPDLIPFLSLTEEEFRERFRGSPIRRAKRKGFLRNVCVALGNTKSPEAVPALTLVLDDQEALLRGHAAWALGQIGSKKGMEALEKRLRIEEDPDVQMEIEAALTEGKNFGSTANDDTALNLEPR
jgi:epoxyqueuosine reductase